MCCEDVAIGRKVNSAQFSVDVGTSSVQVLSPSLDRYSLILCPPLAGTITYSSEQVAVAGDGIVLVAGGGPVRLTLKDHGNLVRSGWSAIADLAGRRATVISALLDKTICDVTL